MTETTLESRAPEAQATLTALLRIAGIGVALDLAIAHQQPGLSIPVFFAFAVALLRGSFRRGRQDDVLLAGAVAVSAFAVVRASELLIALDVLAALGMIAAAAASTPGSAVHATVLDGLRIVERLFRAALAAPGFVVRPLARAVGRTSLARAKPVLRPIAIATPVIVVFAALLASADEVFGRLLIPDLPNVDADFLVVHGGLFVLGATGAAILWEAGRMRDRASTVDRVRVPTRPRAALADWVAVLGGIDVLFVLFVGVQLSVLFGGRHRVEVTPGLTYAEYARSGFFQLIAVGFLTVVVLIAAWDFSARASRRARLLFGWLVSVMVGCTLVILASAWMRLGLYEDAFGATIARLAAAFAILFIAFVLVALPVAMVLGARRHVVSVLLAGAVVWLVAFNVVNPDATVARRNVERFRALHKVDAYYLGGMLGDDAVPAMIDVLDELSDDDAEIVRTHLCMRAALLGEKEPSVRSYNAGRAAARAALRTLRPDCTDVRHHA